MVREYDKETSHKILDIIHRQSLRLRNSIDELSNQRLAQINIFIRKKVHCKVLFKSYVLMLKALLVNEKWGSGQKRIDLYYFLMLIKLAKY